MSEPMAPKITQRKKHMQHNSSMNQKLKKYFNKDFRYTKDGTCAYCGLGPNNPLPSWPKNWKCTLTHSDDDPSKAKHPELWNKLITQDKHCSTPSLSFKMV